jgi:dynein heavy chain, axonemal
VAQEVFLPVITNPRNQHGWPEVITKEVMENMHKFIASVYVTIGQTKGKTLLPMPPSESSGSGGADGASSTTDQIHVLESAIVTWTRQIKGVLKTDPEQALNRDDGEHPGPLTELEFWEDKAANLNAIHEQLSGPKIRKVVTVLDVAKSSYFPAFQKLCKEVAHARVEANDNLLFLKPLDKYFTKLQNNQDEFEGLVELFKPIMHLVMLVWKHSHHYNTPGRIVVLMRQICNDLIMQSQKFLPGGEIFGLEPPEAVEKLKLLLNVLGSFKSFYFEYKGRTTRDTPQNPWKFQNSALFARLDAFLERCHDILDLTQTALQFNKLERVEVGGTKGKALSANVRQIHADFEEALEKLHQVEYDVMDVESKHFDDDFYEFRTCIKELERRLGSVIIQGFEDCVTVGTAFKLFDSFEGLLEREIIMADLEKKQMELVRFFGTDLKEVEAIFHGQRDKPVVGKNLPPCSGAVKWVRALHERVKDPMENLTSLNKLVSFF